MRRWLILIILIQLLGANLWAGLNSSSQLPEPTFGAEFTFTNDEVSEKDFGPNRVKVAEMMTLMGVRCQSRGNCLVKADVDGYRVEYTDRDFWFRVNVDNGVVETQTRPSTLAEYSDVRELLQSDLFDLAAQVKIYPHRNIGGGHIHMGAQSSFGVGTNQENGLLFRNFLVDLVSHPEVGHLWGADLYNSPEVVDIDRLKEFKKVIREFDEGQIKDIQSLAKEIELRVYTSNPWAESADWAPINKYQAKNLTRLSNLKKKWDVDAKTLEHRDIRPQRSVDEFLSQISLFRARLHYLKKLGGALPLYMVDQAQPKNKGNWNQKIAALKRYVEESALPWNPYLEWIRPEYKKTYQEKSVVNKLDPLKEFYQKIFMNNSVAPKCSQVF